MASAGPYACISLQTDNHASTPPLCFLQAGCPSCCPTNSVKALKAVSKILIFYFVWIWVNKLNRYTLCCDVLFCSFVYIVYCCNFSFAFSAFAFSALTLLVRHQEQHPACKNWVMWVMRCWCDCLSGTWCRLLAYGPADATAIPKPIISCLIYIQTGFTFLVVAYPGCPGK